MSQPWPELPFGELYSLPSRNGLMRPSKVRGAGYKMVNMGELYRFDRIADQDMELVPMNERELFNFTLKTGDLLFARQSLKLEGVGKISIVQYVNEPTTFESHLIRVRLDSGRADPYFYYEYFRSPQGKANVLSIASQVAAAGIRASELATLSVPLPPLPIQRKIASILSAYDDLIENNTRRVQVLEDMARTLYREWFVEYRYPGHEQASIDEDAQAHRPSEWQLLEIRDVAPVITRGIAPKYDDGSDNWVINQKCIRDQKLNLLPARRHRSKVPPVKLLRFGDVLINSTGVGTLGRVAQVYQEPVDLSVDTHVTIVRPDQDKVQLDYFGLALMSLQTDFEAAGVGSTGQTELGRERIATTQIIMPPLDIQAEFGQRIRPARQLVQQLLERNTNLRRTRDLLLPKLVSGELDVSTLDIQGVEEQLQEETA